jgi:hypothetical protein
VPYLGGLALLFCAVLVLYKAVHGLLPQSGAAAEDREIWPVFSLVGRYTCLLAGVTVMARIPRLTRSWLWRGVGGLVFLLSVGGYWAFYQADSPGSTLPGLGWISVLFAVVCGAFALLWPAGGMRSLLIPGALFAAGVVWYRLWFVQTDDPHGSLWPLFLAGAAFLYLWWLVALVFDLTFVWHRYIRQSQSVQIFKRPAKLAARPTPPIRN